MSKINKEKLLDSVETRLPFDITRSHLETILEAVLDSITDNIKGGFKVMLSGFGSFEVRTRKGRVGVNPRNPEETIIIPDTRVPKFTAGKSLKDSVK